MASNDDSIARAAAERFVMQRIRAELDAALGDAPPFDWSTQIRARALAVRPGPNGTWVRCGVYRKVSRFRVELDARTGELRSWYFAAQAAGSKRELTPERCLELAQAAAAPPPDAVLAEAEYVDRAGEACFMARWVHVHEGLRVEPDHITVMINGRTGRAFALHRSWHQVSEEFGLR